MREKKRNAWRHSLPFRGLSLILRCFPSLSRCPLLVALCCLLLAPACLAQGNESAFALPIPFAYAMLTVLAFVWGACIGSFANVCIWRIPREESVVLPRSHCRFCRKTIAWYDNIPLLSYLLLRGRCRNCGDPFSPRYFLVELLTGAIFLAVWLKFGLDPRTPIYWLMAAALIIGTFIDFDFLIIPDRITIGGMFVGPLLSALVPELHGAQDWYSGLRASMIGLTVGALSLWLVALLGSIAFRKEAMGMGDVKLLGAIGAFLGWRAVFFTIVASSFFGALVGVSLVLTGRKQFQSKIPYGPYISLAAILWVLCGADLWSAYFRWLTSPLGP